MDTGCLTVIVDLLLCIIAFQEVSHMVNVIEYIRHIEQSHLFTKSVRSAVIPVTILDRTGYTGLILLSGVCRLSARIQLDIDAAVGFFFYQVCGSTQPSYSWW